VVIDLHLRRGTVTLLIVILLTACFIAYMAWGQRGAAASGVQAPPVPASNGMRQYYLTRDTYSGGDALMACDSGYHMASMFEILDPSNLKYNADRGRTQEDSGTVPAVDFSGWMRTGGSSVTSSSPGYASCYACTSDHGGDWGTVAWLGGTWTGDPRDLQVWQAGVAPCSTHFRVWCVQDSAGTAIYLPLLVRLS
jgi:hypothetical protein